MISVFWMLSFKPTFSLSSLTFIKSSLVLLSILPKEWCHLHIWGYWYFSQKPISGKPYFSPACASSSPAFLMMHSAYKLNKQGENIQHFPIWNQSVVPRPVLTVASWPAYRFLKRQVRPSGIPISSRTFHSLLWSTQRLQHSQWSRSRCFSGISLLFLWVNKDWQFDLWFLCLF